MASFLSFVIITQILAIVYTEPSREDMARVFPDMNFEARVPRTRQADHCVFNLCNQTANYNHTLVAGVVARSKKYQAMFGHIVAPDGDMMIENRFDWGGEEQKLNMCPTKQMTVYPLKGLTINNEWKTIVNVKGYYQMVSFEACVPDAECFASENYLPIGFKSYCDTHFIIIRLVVINNDDSVGVEKFSIPSGCSCTYTKGY